MKIACLGWGSLIWKSGALPVAGEWQTDARHAGFAVGDVNLNLIGTGNVEFLEVLGDFVALTLMIGQIVPQLFACFFYEIKKTHSILLFNMKSE